MLMDGHDTGKGDLRKLVDSMMMSWVDAKEGIKITRVGHCLSPWGPTATRPTLQHRRSGGASDSEKAQIFNKYAASQLHYCGAMDGRLLWVLVGPPLGHRNSACTGSRWLTRATA
jgi:hypothetical protein